MPNRASLALYAALCVTVTGLLSFAGVGRRPQQAVEGPALAAESPAMASDVLGQARQWIASAWGVQHAEAAVSPSAGETLFHEKGCIACHGETLQGTDRGPRLLGVGRTLKRQQIERQIREGGGNMPPFGEDAIAPDELALLVDFLAHQKSKK